ncbi:MAG: primosomal protein N' [Prevotella sp.]|nr:primosomal protein N' [Prevotella sp.]
MRYAEVILPVPLDAVFTYSIPNEMEHKLRVGMRVKVPFGKTKTYYGIVRDITDRVPDFVDIKDIIDVIDTMPMVTDKQMKLWTWIADYYMSPIGEVYKAAMPAGMKLEGGYKPKTETCIKLNDKYANEQALHIVLDMLARSKKQLTTFTAFLELSHWDTLEGTTLRSPLAVVTKEELINAAHATTAVVSSLVTKGFIVQYEREVGRINDSREPNLDNVQKLSEAQQTAYNQILMGFMKKDVALLHGVTSSGKTEIYIHLIKRELEHKRQVLYLLPEIALTVQMMERLKKVFGNKLGIYHSKYSDAERVEIWQKQLSSQPYDIILGARSAVLLPFTNLGLVIVDEEHEGSYKQQDPMPRYHARSAAIILASMFGAKTLLGSATPCIETYHNAQKGKYALVSLKTRFKDVAMPEIRVIDIKDRQHRKLMNGPFSFDLITHINDALKQRQQVMLFQNRRGFAPMIECNQCGWVPKCKYCDVSLTLHKTTNQLTCHYCGFTYSVPEKCPCCEGKELKSRGYGTEKIEDAVTNLFPEARVARMDLDTTRTRNAYERIIDDFAAHRTDILIGTQMISKGLDFANVGVVGIINADSMLSYPDFRAYEQAFMMLSQVSGRAGRRGKQGLVILQTRQPELPLISQVTANDYDALYRDLVEEREMFHYPPFCRLIYVYLKHKDDAVVQHAAQEMGVMLRQWFGNRVLGPDKPAVARVKTMSIRKLLLKLEPGIDLKKVRTCLRSVQDSLLGNVRYHTLQVYYDVDPQ